MLIIGYPTDQVVDDEMKSKAALLEDKERITAKTFIFPRETIGARVQKRRLALRGEELGYVDVTFHVESTHAQRRREA